MRLQRIRWHAVHSSGEIRNRSSSFCCARGGIWCMLWFFLFFFLFFKFFLLSPGSIWVWTLVFFIIAEVV